MMEDIEMSQPITIQGDNGGVTVSINMNGKKLSYKKSVGQTTAQCVFIVPSGSVLNLSNGSIADVSNVNGNNSKYVAGVIVNDGTVTASNVTISGCKGLLGGAIKNNKGATLNLKSCTFDGNEAVTNKDVEGSGNGGAIWNKGKVSISRIDDQSFSIVIQNGHAEYGAAIYNDAGGVITMSDDSPEATFYHNKSNVDGGAIFCDGVMTFNHVTFEKNTAQNGNGGAIHISATGNVTIKDDDSSGNIFDGNTASANGGGIYTNGLFSVKGMTANNNVANFGGVLYVGDSGNATINTSATISENKADMQGGAIYNGGTLSMQGTISVKNNTGAKDAANNVFLPKGKVITVSGSLSRSGIGISVAETTGIFTSGYSTTNSGTEPSKIFLPDYYQDFYGVAFSGNEANLDLQSPIMIKEESALRQVLDMFDNFSMKLANDINLSNSTLSIPSGKTVTFDLGGFTLNRGLTSREWDNGGQVITVRNGATLNLSNGTLTGGWGGDSGGISNEGGTVNLTDVTITGCTGDDRGGGICNRNGGTLTMKGGAITNNISRDRMTPEGGGGIFNYEGATMTLTGVTITGNEAKVKGGGGICNFGTLTLDGCTITGNTCGKNGGGIYTAATATLNMKGKMTVTDNKGNGGLTHNVFLKENAVITVTGSLADSKIGITLEDIIGTFTSDYKKSNSDVDPASIFTADIPAVFVAALFGDEVALTLRSLISVDNDADLRIAVDFDGANIQLSGDIKMSNSTLVIGGGKTVTIDLNGKTLDRGLTSRDFDHGGQVITVRKNGTLNLSNGTLTGGYGGNGGGLANENGTATLTNVNITGCKADQRGGGISNYGTLTMTGGSITGNTSNDIEASDVGGGAIYTSSGATTTLSGVTITGNEAKGAGGGGVNNWGTQTIDGCTITGNTSKANGGGVWSGPRTTLQMQGKNTVTDNQSNGKTNNVYLREDVLITVTGSLEGSQIGVGMGTPGTFTSGYGTNNEGLLPIKVFLSDNDDYTVTQRNNEAELKKKMEGETSIAGVESQNKPAEGCYDLNGRKMNAEPSMLKSQLRKDIYIINGKKVLVK